jgi:hypothetical protein
MTNIVKYTGTCRNGHAVRAEIAMTTGQISRQASVPVRCRCGKITQCYLADDGKDAVQGEMTLSSADGPFVCQDPDVRFGEESDA